MALKEQLEFGRWAAQSTEFYAENSRSEKEFLFTRKLVLTARRWTTFVDENIKRESGYARSDWQTLSALAFSDGPVATLELSRRMAVQWPTLVRTLKILETEGLIRRDVDPEDRRSRLVSITSAGRQLVDHMQAVLDPCRKRVLAGFQDEELQTAKRLLDQLFEILGEESKQRR